MEPCRTCDHHQFIYVYDSAGALKSMQEECGYLNKRYFKCGPPDYPQYRSYTDASKTRGLQFIKPRKTKTQGFPSSPKDGMAFWDDDLDIVWIYSKEDGWLQMTSS